MILKNDRGSIMLETTLVLPVFVLIIFFLIQIIFVWAAKQMTYYAAYCGARAALVYNPLDYCAEQYEDGSWQTDGYIKKGVVHHAACSVLSWVSWSLSGYDISGGRGKTFLQDDFFNFNIGSYSVPLSADVRNQVAVSVQEYDALIDENTSGNTSSKSAESKAAIHEQFPAVTVRVVFRCPLFIPLGGPLIAYFFGANDDICIPTDGAITKGGFQAVNGKEIHSYLQSRGHYTETDHWGYYNIDLSESCTMAKPYKTDTFPLMPEEDKKKLRMFY